MDHFEDFLNELSSGKRNKTLDFHFKKGTDIQLFSNIPFGIPSRIPQLDLAIGRIGLPAGRIIEIFGFEMSGKSCMALAAVASVQRLGGCAVWIDTEYCWDPVWAQLNGVDPDRVAIAETKSVEGVFEIQRKAIESYEKLNEKVPYLVVTDSVTAVPSFESLDRDFEQGNRIGTDARAIRNGLRKIIADLAQSKMAFIFINHAIAETNARAFQPQSTSSGGHALKFFAALRIQLARLKTLKDENSKGEKTYEGMQIKAKIAKNKISGKGQIDFDCYLLENGFDLYQNLFEAYQTIGLIKPINSRTFLFEPTQTQLGKKDWKTFIDEQTAGIDKGYSFFLEKAKSLGLIKEYGVNG